MRALPIGTLGLTAVGIYLLVPASGAAETDRTYRLPVQEAKARLAMAAPPQFVFGTEGADIARDEAEGRIVWHVSMNGRELLRYVLVLDAAGDGGTRARLSIEDGARILESARSDDKVDRKSIRALYLTAMDEEVAARLEQRAYNSNRVYVAMMRAAVANMGPLNAWMGGAAKPPRKREIADWP